VGVNEWNGHDEYRGTIGTDADMTETIAVGIEIITAIEITHGRIGGIRTENSKVN